MRSTLVLAIGPLTVLAVASPAFAMSSGFVENRGQVDDEVLYYAPGSGMTVYLTGDGIVLDLRAPIESGGDGGGIAPRDPEAPGPGSRAAAVRIRFADASPMMRAEARGELPARFNFFLGDDPVGWRVDVPCYEEIVYRNIRPGTDLVLRIEKDEVIYELTAAAGGAAQPMAGGLAEAIGCAAAESPAFVFEGAERITSSGVHETHIATAAGTVVDLRSSDGDTRGRLAVLRDARVTEESGAAPAEMRDVPGRLLIGTYIGGSDYDWVQGVALTESGEIVVGGYTQSSNYPTTPGAYDPSSNGVQEVVVSKLSSAGGSLVWSTYLGGTSGDYGGMLALDTAGNVIVVGNTNSTNFPTTAGAYDRTHNGVSDLFVTKLSSTGSAILASTLVGGSTADIMKALALDAAGNVVVTGQTNSSNFPTTAGAYDTTPNGGLDVFAAKVSSTGSALLWSTFLGGAAEECGMAVALDPVEDVVISGYATAATFPTTPGAYDVTYNGDRDVFAAKFSGTGSTLLWSTFLGGSQWDTAGGLDLDAAGNPVLSGGTQSANFPTTAGAYDRTLVFNDAFVAKLASAGNALLWSTFVGGDASADMAYDVILDDVDRPLFTGSTYSSDFPTTPDAYDRSLNGNYDVFVSRLSSTGGSLLWSSYAGGTAADTGCQLVLDPAGNPVVVVTTESTNFPTTPGAYDASVNGRSDFFLLKVDVLDASGIPSAQEASRPCLLFAGPNPFAEWASVRYILPRAGEVDLRVLDIAGRAVADLGGGFTPAGAHTLTWHGVDGTGRRLPAGVYVLQLRTGQGCESRRVVIAR